MAEWECYLDGLLRVSGCPLPPVAALMQSRLTSKREQLLGCSAGEKREIGLPLSVGQEVCRCEAEGEMVLRWRANYGSTSWYEDGDGENVTERYREDWRLQMGDHPLLLHGGQWMPIPCSDDRLHANWEIKAIGKAARNH